MAIDTDTGLTYNPSFPIQGITQPSQPFRDNWSIIQAAVENLQNTQIILGGQATGTSATLGPGNALVSLNLSLAPNLVLTGNGGLTLPVGTTAQRPATPTNGTIRYNTSTLGLEIYSNGWSALAGGVSTINTGTGLTGGPISSSGTISVQLNGISNSLLAQMAPNTIKGNNSNSTANASDLTSSQISTLLGLGTAAFVSKSGSYPYVGSVNGSTIIGNYAVFSDTLGSIQNGGPLANIAALRANLNVVPGLFYVEGYYTLADGGEGYFLYESTDVSSADNGGTIIVDDAGHRWYRQLKDAEPYNIKWFGAYCDGTHNDIVAVNKALSSAGSPGLGVVAPSGVTILLEGSLLIGNASLTTSHSFTCAGGRSELLFNITGHTSHCIIMKGFGYPGNAAPPNIYGRETYPCTLSGFDIVCQNTGLDGLWIGQGINHSIHDIAILQSYRNGITLSPDPGSEIENLQMENVTVSQSGQHGIMLWVNGQYCPVNISRFTNINIRGFAINSVPVFGINPTTQTIQLGCGIYALIMDGGVGGTIDGITFQNVEIDVASTFAVSNGSKPNPNAIVFANGTLNHVIWGTGVSGSNISFGDWHLQDLIIEDVATGGFTSGSTVNVESGVTTNPDIDGYWDGGNYSNFDAACGISNIPYNRSPAGIFSVANGTPININISSGPSLVTVRDNSNTQLGLFLYDHFTLGLYTIHSTLTNLSVADNNNKLEVSSGTGTVSVAVSAILLA